MKEQEQKMKLPKLDDLFTIQEQRDYEKAEKVEEINKSVLVAIAVFIGKTRLIDNFTYEL